MTMRALKTNNNDDHRKRLKQKSKYAKNWSRFQESEEDMKRVEERMWNGTLVDDWRADGGHRKMWMDCKKKQIESIKKEINKR